jgi:hypothetical protein
MLGSTVEYRAVRTAWLDPTMQAHVMKYFNSVCIIPYVKGGSDEWWKHDLSF